MAVDSAAASVEQRLSCNKEQVLKKQDAQRFECEREILGAIYAARPHHQDGWTETNALHLRRQGVAKCACCAANSQWLFNYGPFLYWRKCINCFSERERILHIAFWQHPGCVVS